MAKHPDREPFYGDIDKPKILRDNPTQDRGHVRVVQPDFAPTPRPGRIILNKPQAEDPDYPISRKNRIRGLGGATDFSRFPDYPQESFTDKPVKVGEEGQREGESFSDLMQRLMDEEKARSARELAELGRTLGPSSATVDWLKLISGGLASPRLGTRQRRLGEDSLGRERINVYEIEDRTEERLGEDFRELGTPGEFRRNRQIWISLGGVELKSGSIRMPDGRVHNSDGTTHIPNLTKDPKPGRGYRDSAFAGRISRILDKPPKSERDR